MSHDDIDRDAILARRALFLSSALAALSCSPSAPGGSGTTPTVEVSATPHAGGDSSARADASARTDTDREPPKPPGHKTWDEAIAGAPPRNVSTKISKSEQEQLTSLNGWLDGAYGAVREVWNANPGCDAAKPECRDGWRALGTKVKAAHEQLSGLSRGLCSSGESNPPTQAQRKGQHGVYLMALLAESVEYLAAVAASYSPQGEQEWRKIAANAAEPPPMPCLSCMAPTFYPISAVVPFADGADAFDPAAAEVGAALKGIQTSIAGQPPKGQGKIRIRGHADPQEKDVDKLALSRAKAVVAWLGKNGVDPKRLEAVGMGAEVPVALSTTPMIAAANRRVDVELVVSKP